MRYVVGVLTLGTLIYVAGNVLIPLLACLVIKTPVMAVRVSIYSFVSLRIISFLLAGRVVARRSELHKTACGAITGLMTAAVLLPLDMVGGIIRLSGTYAAVLVLLEVSAVLFGAWLGSRTPQLRIQNAPET